MINVYGDQFLSSLINFFFLTWPLGLMVMFFLFAKLNDDVATTTIVQEFGRHLPTNFSALDEHTIELTSTNLIIVHDCTNSVISLVNVYLYGCDMPKSVLNLRLG